MTTKLQRVDRLKQLPIIGERYLVPTVHGEWFGMVRHWPVIGRKHNDVEFFNFHADHYHIDVRFARVPKYYLDQYPSLSKVMSTPLIAQGNYPLGKLVLRARKCLRKQHKWGFGTSNTLIQFRNAHAGQQCAHGKRGFVCPHRLFPLGSTPAINGVITCPLHGLRVNAETGVILADGETA